MRHGALGHSVRRLTAALAVAASIGMVATPVLAADTLDQSYTATNTADVTHDVIVLAQTYTAGLTGSLNRIDLSIGRFNNPGPLTVQIRTTLAGTPTATVLASASVPTTAVSNDGATHPVSVALPASLSTAGVQYAIVLAAPLATSDTAWLWRMDLSGTFVGGTAWEGDTHLGTWTDRTPHLRAFATYVDPVPCTPGYYSVTGYGPCTAASPGNFVASQGSVAQSPCPLGTFQPLSAAASCILAPLGYYVPTTGATAPTAADPGHFVATAGSATQTECALGTFQPNSASASCFLAPLGYYVPSTGAIADVGADPGHFVAIQGSATQTECAPGTFQPNSAAAACDLAPAGYYVPTTGATAPTAADPGHFVATAGSATQTECALGTFQPASAAASCILAPVGSYVDTTGAVEATPCPNGEPTAGEGSTSISACIGDTTPPVITYTVTGTLGLNGWYTSDVTLTWSVVEPETPESLVTTGCADQTITTDQDATTYSCAATSLGGAAGPVTVTIKRDTTPPAIDCSASPNVLWPPNNKLVPVTVTVTAPGATFALTSVSASAGVAGDMQGWTTGTPDTAGLLRATRSGSGSDRTYTLTYQATDDAGNTASCSTTVVVPHDMGTR